MEQLDRRKFLQRTPVPLPLPLGKERGGGGVWLDSDIVVPVVALTVFERWRQAAWCVEA